MTFPIIAHPLHADRDEHGRFIAGNTGRPPASPVSRLRSEAQRIVVAHFARNQDHVLDHLLRTNPSLYVSLVLNAANEADNRAVPDLDPGAASPVDLIGLNREADLRRREEANRKAVSQARTDAELAAEFEDWEADRHYTGEEEA